MGPKLEEERASRIAQIVGALLYYGRAVDLSILVALSTIAAQKNNPTEKTDKAVTQLMYYLATHPDATI
jgi:hypothetical protein